MLESKLDFIKEAGKPGCPFKLLGVQRSVDICAADIEVPPGRKLTQQLPLTCRLTISNLGGRKAGSTGHGVDLETQDIETKTVERGAFKRSKVVAPGHLFTVLSARPDGAPARVRFAVPV